MQCRSGRRSLRARAQLPVAATRGQGRLVVSVLSSESGGFSPNLALGKAEGEEEEVDQSEPMMHQRCCNTPSRHMSHPHTSIQALLFTSGRAPLNDRRPVGLASMREFRSAKELPPISVNIPMLLIYGDDD